MSWFLALNYKQMKKIVRIITIVVFIIAAFPIISYIKKGNEKSVEQYKEARKVETEQAFAEALKTDGWIYAKGAFIGKAPLEKLTEGSKALSVDALFTNKSDTESITKLLKGDFIRIWLTIGEVEREKPGDPFSIDPTYTARTETENISFLGHPFDKEKIIPLLFRKEKIQFPESGSSLDGYELEMIRSPYETWIKVLVADGKIVEKELSLTADEQMQSLKAAAEGTSNSLNTYAVAGFLGFWLVLLLIVLWLEGKWIKR